MFSKPGNEIILKVSTNAIQKYYASYFNNEQTDHIDFDNKYYYLFSIKFRECVMGEIFIEKLNRYIYKIKYLINFKSCMQCPKGKYNLFDPMNYTKCKNCPSNANCLGGSILIVSPG